MGQYLAIGIMRSFSVNKSEIESARISRDELENLIVSEQGYDFSLLDVVETEAYFTYKLKDGVLKENLNPLLKQLYPMLYSNPVEYDSVLTKISDMSELELIKYADGKPEECFQRDSYSEIDSICVNNRYVDVSYGDLIMLCHEGKISMETYGKIFGFTKLCIVRAFPDLKLAPCLRVYITG
jgi:hypothetical protein